MITRHLTALLIAGAAFVGASSPAGATTITVPDGTFTQAGNIGSIGGGLLGSATNATIGSSGPWVGTFSGITTLIPLLPPTLTIAGSGGYPSGGRATISGITAGLALLGGGLVDSTASFYQSLSSTSYLPNTIYTLTANVSVGGLLTANALAGSGVGIGLTNGSGNLVGATNTAGPAFVSLSLLNGNDYRLQLVYTTAVSTPSGPIGISLFDNPGGLVSASLLSGISFSNVTLDATPVGNSTTPEPAALLLSGAGLLGLGLYRLRALRSRS